MVQRIVYVLQSEEAEYVAGELASSSRFENVDFRAIERGDISRSVVGSVENVPRYSGPSPFPRRCAFIWGSGEDHDLSLIFSPEEAYRKSVDDAHDDFSRTAIWTNECSHNSNLPKFDSLLRELEIVCQYDGGFTLGNYKDALSVNFRTTGSRFGRERVEEVIHKSIDLDTIRDFPARSDWQVGYETLESVRDDFRMVCATNYVARFDIGGLHFPSNGESGCKARVNPEENELAMKFAVRCYSELLGVFLDSVSPKE